MEIDLRRKDIDLKTLKTIIERTFEIGENAAKIERFIVTKDQYLKLKQAIRDNLPQYIYDDKISYRGIPIVC